jgi:hypothetical protein
VKNLHDITDLTDAELNDLLGYDPTRTILPVRITYACAGWLDLQVGAVYDAERLVGDRGAYWHIAEIGKDVPDYAVEVL